MKSNRNLSVDTLRGLACLLLVSFHVIGSNEINGLRISDGWYREVNDIFVFIRMPLFTFLSGYIYANRPYASHSKQYIRGKVNRLIIPLLVVGSIFAIIQSTVPGSNQGIDNWFLLHILPVGHYWFLEAIFLIFILMIPLERFQLLSTKRSFLIVFFVSSLLFTSNLEIQYFSISGFIYLLPFFLIGLAVNRFGLMSYITFKHALIITAILVFALISIFNGTINVESKRSLLSLLIGCFSCFILLRYQLQSQILAKIGIYSYSIYLFHVFFTAGTRIVLTKVGETNLDIIFLTSLILGTLGPIFIDFILSRNKITRLLCLGK